LIERLNVPSMNLVGGGGGSPKKLPVTRCTSVKLNEPDTRAEDMLDTVIEPLLPLWFAAASHDSSVGDCKLAVTTSGWAMRNWNPGTS
jgi:hypothetical protein